MNIYDLTLDDLAEYLKPLCEPPYRAGQIFKSIYKVKSFEDITNIPKALREKLKEDFYFHIPAIQKKLISKIDGTRKYLFKLCDCVAVESVVMRYRHGLSICVSSQAGCRMGCKFCASGMYGLVRNLTAGEISGQILAAEEDLGERISNVVIMGSGEPFDNADNVFKFLENAVHPDGMGIGARHITISTCGLLSGIRRLGDCGIPANLSVSLHAPNDEIRRKIMPVAKSAAIDEIISECRAYFNKTKRRVTFEYALIDGVNDTDECAAELAEISRGFHINLIPVNEVPGKEYRKSKKNAVKTFAKILRDKGVAVTIRREMGADISAACGQLRNQNV